MYLYLFVSLAQAVVTSSDLSLQVEVVRERVDNLYVPPVPSLITCPLLGYVLLRVHVQDMKSEAKIIVDIKFSDEYGNIRGNDDSRFDKKMCTIPILSKEDCESYGIRNLVYDFQN